LEISNKDSQVEFGVETDYEIRVTNKGSWAATGVQIVASVPEGMVPVKAKGPPSFNIDQQQVIFEPIAKLNPGSDTQFRVRVRGIKAGDWRFKVQLTADQLRAPLTKEENTLVYKDQ
jgi:uncharacterized repeat protein (TIGR01451 family)